MKISEFIYKLAEIQNKIGDVDVFLERERGSGSRSFLSVVGCEQIHVHADVPSVIVVGDPRTQKEYPKWH